METTRVARILTDLVSFDTTSSRSNIPIVDYIDGFLSDLGYRVLRIPNSDGSKEGLLAVCGPRSVPGLVLSAHTDVVPATKEDWSNDPFTLTQVGNQLVGRGACDMKGFIACVLDWAERHATQDLSAPVWIALSRDEELGCIGAVDIVNAFQSEGGQAKLCIVGEPTVGDVVLAHKGIFQVTATVTGTQAHSSLAPKAVNAVQAAARAISYLADLADKRQADGPHDPNFDVSHSTIHTGTISGGTVANIVPKHCTFEFELRYLPGEGYSDFYHDVQRYVAEELEPAMKTKCRDCGFRFEINSDAPALDENVLADLVARVVTATGGRPTRKVAYATDAGHFHAAGIPTLVCGPGDIENAHKPDESISVDDLSDYGRFLDRIGTDLL